MHVKTQSKLMSVLCALALVACGKTGTPPAATDAASISTKVARGAAAATPASPFVVLGTGGVLGDRSANSFVTVFDETTKTARSFSPYGAGWKGEIRVAVADVNRDGYPDIITGPGPGGGPHLRVFSGSDGSLLVDRMAFSESVGLFVAACDIDNDGYADVVVGADAPGGPRVRVFGGRDGRLLKDFFAFDASFGGGVRVACGDVDGDGYGDIVAAAGPGGGPHVKVFSGKNGALIRSFYAAEPSFAQGIYVAAGDVDADGKADIVTGAGAGGVAKVTAFSGANQSVIASFAAYASGYGGGLRPGLLDLDGDGRADLIAAAGLGGSSLVQIMRFSDQRIIGWDVPVQSNVFPGYYMAGGRGPVPQAPTASLPLSPPDPAPSIAGKWKIYSGQLSFSTSQYSFNADGTGVLYTSNLEGDAYCAFNYAYAGNGTFNLTPPRLLVQRGPYPLCSGGAASVKIAGAALLLHGTYGDTWLVR